MAAPPKAAKFAETALKAHSKAVRNEGEPLETRIMDLVTDIMHLSRRMRLDFESITRQAAAHVEAEEAGEY